MPKNFVYTTLSGSVDYVNHKGGANDLPLPVMVDGRPGVLIQGGHGVVKRGRNLITPLGVSTEVTDAQLTYLQENPIFQLHEKNKFITVLQRDVSPEKVAADLEPKDASAPLTPSDFVNQPDGAPKLMDPEDKPASKKSGRRSTSDE